jgi:hypothetical protein
MSQTRQSLPEAPRRLSVNTLYFIELEKTGESGASGTIVAYVRRDEQRLNHEAG